MDQPSSSFPRRDHAAPEIDEVERIASQVSWDNLADIGVQSGNDDADDGMQSRDDDADDLENEGPRIGHGDWVDGMWHNPIDPHPMAPSERRSGVGYYAILVARTCLNLCLVSSLLPSSSKSGDPPPNNHLP
ncbi:hypothetical protein C2845_PM05G21440 [Panicum miliaceum]|uniref:Uncharacterized protein n=1 Tax=Panicum miliaceum TaxID=4540 RepID=A0A3L6T2G1_PANMI|nr:hypothetical protein C2845_PM05G21440 [Panicum miliaceum]